MPDDPNDIESYWEGIRPKRAPQKIGWDRYSKRVKDLTDDERKALIESVPIGNRHRASTLLGFSTLTEDERSRLLRVTGIRELTEDERADLIRAQPPIEDQRDRSLREVPQSSPPWHPDYRADSNFIDPSVRLETAQRSLREAPQTPDPMSNEDEDRNPMREFGNTTQTLNQRVANLIRDFCDDDDRLTIRRGIEEGINQVHVISLGDLNRNFATVISRLDPEIQTALNYWYRSVGPYSRVSVPQSVLNALSPTEDEERVIPFDELDEEVRRRNSPLHRGYIPEVSMGTSMASAYQAGREEGLRFLREESSRISGGLSQLLNHPGQEVLLYASQEIPENQLVQDLIRELPSIETVRQALLIELDREPSFLELATSFARVGGSFRQLDREIQQLRQRIPTPENRQAEYDRLATAAGLPSGSVTVERGNHDLMERIFSDPINPIGVPSMGLPGTQAEWATAAGLEPTGHPTDVMGRMLPSSNESPDQFIDRVTATLEGRASPYARQTLANNAISNLTNALIALGFPPVSISVEAPTDGSSSLTLHMPPSVEFETDSGPDEVSVTFSHRR
jgi:hypothetical protein